MASDGGFNWLVTDSSGMVPVDAGTTVSLSHHPEREVTEDEGPDSEDVDGDDGGSDFMDDFEQTQATMNAVFGSSSAAAAGDGNAPSYTAYTPAEFEAKFGRVLDDDDGPEDEDDEDGEATGKPATSTGASAAAKYLMERHKLVQRQGATAAETGDDLGVPAGEAFGRNRLKELFQRGKRALGLKGKAREMRLYHTIQPTAGSFGAGLLKIMANLTDNETLMASMAAKDFGRLFSSGRFRTEEQKCSLYVMDKKPRQLLNNKRIHVNFYYPLESADTELVGGYNLVIMEYDLRARTGQTEKAETSYGLYKSSLLHLRGKDESRADLIKSAVLTLDFGKLPEVNLLPQLAGDAKSEAIRRQLADNLYYSTGVLSRETPMVIFRFGPSSEPGDDWRQTLDFVYIIVPQADAKPGLAQLIDVIHTNQETRDAAAAALDRIAEAPVAGNETERATMKQAAWLLGQYFTEKVQPSLSAAVREQRSYTGHTLPYTAQYVRADYVDEFETEFRNLFGNLGTTPVDAKRGFMSTQSAEDQAALQTYLKTDPTSLACCLSQMIYAAQRHVTKEDATARVGQLWTRGVSAFTQHFSSPLVAARLDAVQGVPVGVRRDRTANRTRMPGYAAFYDLADSDGGLPQRLRKQSPNSRPTVLTKELWSILPQGALVAADKNYAGFELHHMDRATANTRAAALKAYAEEGSGLINQLWDTLSEHEQRYFATM